MQKKFLGKIIDDQSNGIIILNKDLIVLYANNKVRDFFLSDTNQLLGNYLKCNYTIEEKTYCQNTSNCYKCTLNNTIKKVMESNNAEIVENLKYNSDGKNINLSFKISCIDDHIIIEFMDLCNLYEEINFLTRMMDKSRDIMFFKDSQLRYRYVNKRCADLFNKEKIDILNKDDKELIEENSLDKSLCLKLEKGDLNTLEEGYYSDIIFYEDRYLNVTKEKIDGGILCIARDITEEIEANKRAEIDFLTNLYNRRKFIYTMDDILANKKDNYYLALMDLDDLKNLNNEYGHLKGDKYLSKLGEILKKYGSEQFFRIGGDEFAGVIEGNRDDVKNIFTHIFEELRNLDYNPPLSLSVGINKLNVNKSYIENYREVDSLLYKVKKDGKNSFILL